ncbi:MAG: ATP-grasp domain-containing protein [Clostridia bacterium]|nr:ATP-grasp domain-containing protein [Clostridia bacterium]
MKKFEGKVLLELGTSVGSVEIVKYAKSQGAYVIVTDYLPTEKSKAKQIADETAMISTTDIESLCKFAEEKKIDGVFCGVSELNLLSVYAIAKYLNLPCYFTEEQWNICQDKTNFKEYCQKFNVPVPQKYDFLGFPTHDEISKVSFPVIVKPVDQGAGIGIHICSNPEELLAAYQDAYEKSFSHKVIVEDYLVGEEFSAAYTVINGEYRLSMIGDKHLNREQEGLLPLPEAYVYPSKNIALYIKQCNNNVIKMFKSMGIENGTFFVQGIVDGEKIAVFEAGLRMGGTALFRFIDKINGINILELLTDYALTGKMEGDINKEDVNLKGKKCCLLSLLNKGGKISEIIGVNEAAKVSGVRETIVRYNVGECIARSGTLKQSHIRFFVVKDSIDALAESIKKIQELVSVRDEFDNEMLLSNFDTRKLYK